MGKGKTVPHEIAKLIYQTYLTGPKGAAKDLCLNLGYKERTYYKIINAQGEIYPKYVSPPKRWTQDQINTVTDYISTYSQATLEDILHEFVENRNYPKISLATLWNYLDGELFTVKLVSAENQMRNDINVKKERKEYCEWFLQNQQRTFLFIDECGYNLNTIRRQARSKSGQKAVAVVAQNKGTNMSVCACVNKDLGLVYYSNQEHAMNSEDFMVFLSNLYYTIKDLNLPNVTLIMDNCRIHVEDIVDNVCSLAGWEYCFLPPYSPMCNIIEESYAILKFAIKRLLAGPLLERKLKIANLPYGAKANARRLLLEEALEKCIGEITPDKVTAFWDHMMSLMPKMIAMEDV